jgi:hypothetical protein
MEAIRSLVPDIAILDISMPGLTAWKSSPSPIPKIFARDWSFSPNLLKTVNWLWLPRPVPTVSF